MIRHMIQLKATDRMRAEKYLATYKGNECTILYNIIKCLDYMELVVLIINESCTWNIVLCFVFLFVSFQNIYS